MEKIAKHTTAGALIKIAIVGPESTGKTFLARELASHYQVQWVPEFAREYLDKTDGKYQESDLLEIARGQVNLEDKIAAKNRGPLICDTNLLVIKIWSEHRYQQCHPWILAEWQRRKYHLHILCNIDFPWELDPLREHPHLRTYFFERYKAALMAAKSPFLVLSGSKVERFNAAVAAINNLR
ncbi:ATP-binding protein [Fulvivirgaceae bacterium BMA12]|uniref:ATP-binding protein n=1 Tax=Agaribacillus aureus TaxID=3051825 RepID=A0ABT8LCA0_9BACT|nr:ATP-binding protein [Fulvivirgaceae bacterium BMA12]